MSKEVAKKTMSEIINVDASSGEFEIDEKNHAEFKPKEAVRTKGSISQNKDVSKVKEDNRTK